MCLFCKLELSNFFWSPQSITVSQLQGWLSLYLQICEDYGFMPDKKCLVDGLIFHTCSGFFYGRVRWAFGKSFQESRPSVMK